MATKASLVAMGVIQVQSSKYSPDYLEWRINKFLNEVEPFTEEKVENVKKAEIKHYEQVKLNLFQETNSYWD